MKKAGASEKEIKAAFNEPVEMRVFSWGGAIDTTMSPLDSIRYHKSFRVPASCRWIRAPVM